MKTVISGGMGFVLGGAFGLFMSSVCVNQKRIDRVSIVADFEGINHR